jgi:hypothetical protein
MLTIRQEQMEALGRMMLERFADDMVRHLRESFPSKCAALGEVGVRDAIQDGISRAGRYGVQKHSDICRFIDMMFVFGADFDTNPKMLWAARILTDPSITDPDTRMYRLYEEARRVQ